MGEVYRASDSRLGRAQPSERPRRARHRCRRRRDLSSFRVAGRRVTSLSTEQRQATAGPGSGTRPTSGCRTRRGARQGHRTAMSNPPTFSSCATVGSKFWTSASPRPSTRTPRAPSPPRQGSWWGRCPICRLSRRGQTLDSRSDFFSFGCFVFEMATGQRAFRGPTAADTVSAILNRDPMTEAPAASDLPRFSLGSSGTALRRIRTTGINPLKTCLLILKWRRDILE